MPPQPRADLEQVVLGPEREPVAEQAVLVLLRVGERLRRRLEDRARVGHRRVEPELEERRSRGRSAPARPGATRAARAAGAVAGSRRARVRARRARPRRRSARSCRRTARAGPRGRASATRRAWKPSPSASRGVRASRRRNAQSSTSSRAGRPSSGPVAAPRAVGQDAARAARCGCGGGSRRRRAGRAPRPGRGAGRLMPPPIPGRARTAACGGTARRLAARRSACSRISALTWNVISGRRASTRAQRAPVELDPARGEHGLEEAGAVALLVDPHRHELARLGVELEQVAALEIHERRHVERLVGGHPHAAAGIGRSVGHEQVAVALAEGVVHLGDDAARARRPRRGTSRTRPG